MESSILLPHLPCLNLDNPLGRKLVIPAQAGIQLKNKNFSCNGSKFKLSPLRGGLFSLDSRLRGNDGSNELSSNELPGLNLEMELLRRL